MITPLEAYLKDKTDPGSRIGYYTYSIFYTIYPPPPPLPTLTETSGH